MNVSPASAAELSQLLRDTAWSDERVSISGGGTRATFGNACEPTEIDISLGSLNNVIDYSPDDLVIAVEAGCTLNQINAVLEQHDQWLPVTAAHPERATIGGAFATGIGGPIRTLRGALKDLVVGVEAVLADGTIAKSGGMTVKNVSGYDMSKLYAGSLGAFGIVSRLNIKVFPRPQACQKLTVQASDADAMFEFVSWLLQHAGEGGEYFLRCTGATCELHYRHFGASSVVPLIVEQLVSAAQQFKLDAQVEESEVTTSSVFTEAIDCLGSKSIVRVGAKFDQQVTTVERLLNAGCDTVFIDPAAGLVYGLGTPHKEWRDAMLAGLDCSTFLSLPPDLKQGIDVFGALNPPVATLTQRLKDEFDPARRLNPGRYLMGL